VLVSEPLGGIGAHDVRRKDAPQEARNRILGSMANAFILIFDSWSVITET